MKIEYDLARARKFLKETGMDADFSVSIRTIRSGEKYYILLKNNEASPQLLSKATNMDSLMEYITIHDNMLHEIWDLTVPDKPGAVRDNIEEAFNIDFEQAIKELT